MSSHTIDALDLLPPITGTQTRGRGHKTHTSQVNKSKSVVTTREVKPNEPILQDEEAPIEPVSASKSWRSYLRMPSLGRSSQSNTNSQVADGTSTSSISSSAATVNSQAAAPQPSGGTRSGSASSFLRRSLTVALGSPCLWWQHEEEKSSKKEIESVTAPVAAQADIISPLTSSSEGKPATRIDRQLAFDEEEVLIKKSNSSSSSGGGTVTTTTMVTRTRQTNHAKSSTAPVLVTSSTTRKRERSKSHEGHSTTHVHLPAGIDYHSMLFSDLVELCKRHEIRLPSRPKKVDCIALLNKAAASNSSIPLEMSTPVREPSVTSPITSSSNKKRARSTSSAASAKSKVSVDTNKKDAPVVPFQYETMTVKVLRELLKKRGTYSTDLTTKAKMIAVLIEGDRINTTTSKTIETSPSQSKNAPVQGGKKAALAKSKSGEVKAKAKRK